MNSTLFTDGGARGNPGPAGIGFALTISGSDPIEIGQYIGEATNNQAEYMALVAGLLRAKEEGVSALDCYLDSELVVKQMKGLYRVKHVDLKPLYEEAKGLARAIGRVTYTHVRREKNRIADRLVNEAIDAHSR